MAFILKEGKSIKSSSGFSGKGFKFDETEHALANERKKLQKAALGLQDSDDEDGALDVSLHYKAAWDFFLPFSILHINVVQLPHIWSMCPSQIEEQIESMFNSKKRVKDLSAPGSSSGSSGAATTTATVAGGLPGFGPTSAGNIQKLEMAKRLALKINAQKNLGAEAQVC